MKLAKEARLAPLCIIFAPASQALAQHWSFLQSYQPSCASLLCAEKACRETESAMHQLLDHLAYLQHDSWHRNKQQKHYLLCPE